MRLPKASVGAKHLKKNSVTAKKIKKGAVTGAASSNGSLKAGDFAPGQVPAGPKGDPGVPGSARAFAYLFEESCNVGPCELERSKGFRGARRASTGVYCLTPEPGIDPASSVALVSVDYSNTNSPEGNASAMVRHSVTGRNTGELAVVTERLQVTGAPAESAEADNVSFFVAIL